MSVNHAIKGQPSHTHETAAQARECDAWHRRVTAPAAERPAARPERTDAQRYEFIVGRIESMVASLNADLGYSTEFDEHFARTCVTFGYIGNCGNGFDDRLWSVFLPHPGRVGTSDDSIGRFTTGDLAGAQATLNALHGFRRGVRFLLDNEPESVREAREAHRAFVEDGIA